MRHLNGDVACVKELGRRRAVPVVFLQGSHYDVGYDVGRIFSSLIKSFISSFDNLRLFEREYQTDTGRAAYDKTLANMKKRFPQYVREMQGVADGADVPFYKLFLLQMDDLIGTINEPPRRDNGGCTSLGVISQHHNVLGHTEDALSETLNHFYIMSAHITPSQEEKEMGAREERFSSLCYAGQMPGYTSGFNAHGLVFSINTLSPLVLIPGNTPRTFVTRSLLSARSFEDAERILLDEGLGVGNGFSVNMLWTEAAEKRRLYNVEVAPNHTADRSQLNIHAYGNDTLVHCNMYQRLKVAEVMEPIIDSSVARLAAIKRYAPPRNANDIANMLSDTSGKDFHVFQDGPVIKTITAGIFDLEKRTWSLYIDKPNSSEAVAVLPISFPWLDKDNNAI